MTVEARAVVWATALFALSETGFLALVTFAPDLPAFVSWLPYVAVFLCASLAGYLASDRVWRQVVALGLAITATIGVLNWAWSALGLPADLAGPGGSLIVAMVSLPFVVAMSGAGVLVGRRLQGAARS